MTILLSELKSLLKHIELSNQLIDTETLIAVEGYNNLNGLTDEYYLYEALGGKQILSFKTLSTELELAD